MAGLAALLICTGAWCAVGPGPGPSCPPAAACTLNMMSGQFSRVRTWNTRLHALCRVGGAKGPRDMPQAIMDWPQSTLFCPAAAAGHRQPPLPRKHAAISHEAVPQAQEAGQRWVKLQGLPAKHLEADERKDKDEEDLHQGSRSRGGSSSAPKAPYPGTALSSALTCCTVLRQQMLHP